MCLSQPASFDSLRLLIFMLLLLALLSERMLSYCSVSTWPSSLNICARDYSNGTLTNKTLLSTIIWFPLPLLHNQHAIWKISPSEILAYCHNLLQCFSQYSSFFMAPPKTSASEYVCAHAHHTFSFLLWMDCGISTALPNLFRELQILNTTATALVLSLNHLWFFPSTPLPSGMCLFLGQDPAIWLSSPRLILHTAGQPPWSSADPNGLGVQLAASDLLNTTTTPPQSMSSNSRSHPEQGINSCMSVTYCFVLPKAHSPFAVVLHPSWPSSLKK